MIKKESKPKLSFTTANINLFITAIFIASACFLLIKNFHFRSGLISDVHLYINDGRQYANLELPTSIHAAPIYPLLIGINSLVTQNYVRAIDIAITINVISSVLALVFLAKLAKEYDKTNFLGLLTVFAIATHPLFFLNAVDGSTEPLFYLFTLLILVSVKKKNFRKASWFVLLSTLTRLEGIAFAIPLGFYLFRKEWPSIKTNPKKIIKSSLFPLILLATTLGLIAIHNFINGEKYGSFYLYEIASSIKGYGGQIPNFDFIENLSNSIFIRYGDSNVSLPIVNNAYSIIVWFFIGYLAFNSRDITSKVTGQGLLGYGVLHLFFPYYQNRYLSIVVFLAIFFILKKALTDPTQTKKILIVVAIIVLFTHNLPIFNKAATGMIWRSEHQYDQSLIITNWFKESSDHLQRPILFIYHQPPLVLNYLEPSKKKEVSGYYYDEFLDKIVEESSHEYFSKYKTIILATNNVFLEKKINYMASQKKKTIVKLKKWLLNADLKKQYSYQNKVDIFIVNIK